MASLFERFNAECDRKLVFKKLSDLNIGPHPIFKFQFTKSLFGKEGRRLSVVLYDENENSNAIVHLPDRFLNIVKTDDDINQMNSEKYNLIYMGIDVQQKNKYLIRLEAVSN